MKTPIEELLWECTYEDSPIKFKYVEAARVELADLRAQLATSQARLVEVEAEVKQLKETARKQYWAMREGDNIVRHIRTLIFPGWTNLSDHDVNECLRDYEKEHNIVPNYALKDPPKKNNFPSINVSSTGEAPGSLL